MELPPHRRHIEALKACFGATVLVLAACGDRERSCEEILQLARNARQLSNAQLLIKLTDQGLQCPDITPIQRWQFTLYRSEALTLLSDYNSAVSLLGAVPPQAPEFADIQALRLIDLSDIHMKRSDFGLALQELQQAEAFVHSGNRDRLTDIAIRKLYAYGARRDLVAARSEFNRLSQLLQTNDRPELDAAYAYVLMKAVRFEEARQYYERALAHFNNDLRKAELRLNLSAIDYYLGDYERSMEACSNAIPIFERVGEKRNLRICLNSIGLAHLARGETDLASRNLKEALVLAQRLGGSDEGEALSNLALAAISANEWDAADSFNNRALAITKRYDDTDAELYRLVNRAQILEGRGNYPEALATLDGVTQRRFVNPEPRLNAERTYISIFRKLNNEPAARRHYRASLDLVERVRARMSDNENKLTYYASQNSLNQEWVRLLIGKGQTDEALQDAEASRARLMLERLRLASLSNTHVDLRRIAREQDAALISYWLAPETSYVWVVTSQLITVSELPGEEDIRPLVESFRAFLERRGDPLAVPSASEALRKAVVDPVLPLIGNRQQVFVVPDGVLNGLSFDALPVNGRYWIEDKTLSVAPSLILLEKRRAAFKAAHSALLLGDALPTPEFSKLDYASREIEGIAACFPIGTTQVRGAAATPEAYLSQVATQNYIHFAAHADANAERPLDSAVILSPGKNGERLTARALLNKPINAELVTISACRSAGIRSYRGEGLVGFAWAFLQSGARGVIAGSWDASDDSTSRIMVDLYARIAKGETPPEALRHAKLALIRSNTHFRLPYYWAPFQYYAGVGREKRVR